MRASGINPLTHYQQTGWREGRDPGPNFDIKLYLLHNPDVAAAGIDPLGHFLQFGMAEGRAAYQAIGSTVSRLRRRVLSVAQSRRGGGRRRSAVAFQHHRLERRPQPERLFDTAGYLAHYTDVRSAGHQPADALRELRLDRRARPFGELRHAAYLSTYTDVAAAGVNPLDHYLNSGIYEGRSTFARRRRGTC